jgi:hypothetical protein
LLLTTQESALSDLLRITSIVLFTPPVPYTWDQTPKDNGLGKCTFSSYRSIVVPRTLQKHPENHYIVLAATKKVDAKLKQAVSVATREYDKK